MSVFPQIDESVTYGDFRDDLARDGYVIIKGAIPRDRALHYRDEFFSFVEKFPLGFKRDDPSTWTQEHMPIVNKGGLFGHSVGHEAFLWSIRLEQNVIDAFAKCWGTDELIVSFDGGNLSLPGPMQNYGASKWAHVDQQPLKKGIRSIQGIVNLNDNGPEDGGLIVLPGSHKFYDGFFDEEWAKQADREWLPGGAREKQDFYPFKPSEYGWFEEQCGEWKKVCVEPGDLILWESRTMHYNVPPKGQKDRCAVYVCYEPASAGDVENFQKKRHAFNERIQSTHWPISQVRLKDELILRDGEPCPHRRTKPWVEPEITPKLLKLAGVEAY